MGSFKGIVTVYDQIMRDAATREAHDALMREYAESGVCESLAELGHNAKGALAESLARFIDKGWH